MDFAVLTQQYSFLFQNSQTGCFFRLSFQKDHLLSGFYMLSYSRPQNYKTAEAGKHLTLSSLILLLKTESAKTGYPGLCPAGL